MNKAQFSTCLSRLVSIVIAAFSIARAQVAGPGGHYYQVVLEPNLLWEEAKAHAEEATFNGVHGYLATITSAEEDQFIEDLRIDAAPGGDGSLWVGGWQEPATTNAFQNWFWVNGEGSIPTMSAEAGYSNWQQGEPNDNSGPSSENYLSVGRLNQFGWGDELNDRHIVGYVVEFPGAGARSTVKVVATDPVATEQADSGGIGIATLDTAVFTFSRDGDLSLDLPVFYSVHGTATSGGDYNEIAKSIIIPAGQSEVRLQIVPRADLLAVVEPMETVGIRLERSLINTPTSAYKIDIEHREAAAVIYEAKPPTRPSVEVAVPRNGFAYDLRASVVILAAMYSTQTVTTLNFYADNQLIGSASNTDKTLGLRFFKFVWTNPPPGTPTLVARAALAIDNPPTSTAVKVSIPGVVAPPVVAVRFVEPTTTEPLPDADFAPGYLEVARNVSGDADLKVFYSIGGTATADVDYEALQGYVVIPAGKTAAKIVVTAKDDFIYEGRETVVVTLLQPVDVDPAPYTVNTEHGNATITIVDGDSPPPGANPVVKITRPVEGATFLETEKIPIRAAASDPDGSIVRLELLLDGNVIGTNAGPVLEVSFQAEVGAHTLTARAMDNSGATIVSEPIHVLVRHPEAVAFVHRELPAAYTAGVSFVVQMRADPPGGAFAYAVEDRPPTGWVVADVSDEGVFDRVNGKVKFGPFIDDVPRTLTYRATPPSGATGVFEFTGGSSVNGAIYPIIGDTRIEQARQNHPADENQDFVLTMSEVTSYAAAWKAGRSWSAGPVPIPLNYVTRAHHIWQRAETYRFDGTAGAPPACWVPVTAGGAGGGFTTMAIGSAQRVVLGELRSSTSMQVRITVGPPAGASGFAVEERPPHGWTISNISHEGIFDAATGAIRWGVFPDAVTRTLTYILTPPPIVSSVGVFAGQLSFDGNGVEVAADSRLENSVTVSGVAPVQINNCEVAASGIKLNLIGPAGQTGVIETSTDFTTWTEVKSIFIPNGAVEFIDETPAQNRRFYRLRVQ